MTSTVDVERPIFIVGAGRSGTTLLRTMLSAHPRIAITPETHFLKEVAPAVVDGSGSPSDFDGFWEDYTRSMRFRDLGVDADRCLELVDWCGESTFRAVFAALLTAYGERLGVERIGEKTPGHVFHLGTMLSWFPDARIVVVRRDPRAVVASQLSTPWVAPHISRASLRRGLLVGSRWLAVVEQVRRWKAVYEEAVPDHSDDPRVQLVSYEALARDPEGQLRELCAFVDEAYEPLMLSGRTDALIPEPEGAPRSEAWRAWRKSHHQQALRPVSTASIDRWRADLSRVEVALVEGRCQGSMRSAGYAFSAPPLVRYLGGAAAPLLLALSRAEARLRAAARRILLRI